MSAMSLTKECMKRGGARVLYGNHIRPVDKSISNCTVLKRKDFRCTIPEMIRVLILQNRQI